MSINNAILGILSCKSLSGYDLKKIIQESTYMHWSGNNNQIYKALTELVDEGYVTGEVFHQESSPSKKIYTITEAGKEELKEWVLSRPEPPEFRKLFLIQLAWADQLEQEEVNRLLQSYENEIKLQLMLQQAQKNRESFSPNRTKREAFLWDMIHENMISSYENELAWIRKLQKELCNQKNEEEDQVNYKIIEKNKMRYIEYSALEAPIRSEQDVLDLIAACFEHEVNHMLLNSEALSEDFFKLKSGLAGMMLQKLSNYRIKLAVVRTPELAIKGKFKELLAESNRGNDFRIFDNVEEAEAWLLNIK